MNREPTIGLGVVVTLALCCAGPIILSLLGSGAVLGALSGVGRRSPAAHERRRPPHDHRHPGRGSGDAPTSSTARTPEYVRGPRMSLSLSLRKPQIGCE